MSTYNDIFEETIGITMPKSVENLNEGNIQPSSSITTEIGHMLKYQYCTGKQDTSWITTISRSIDEIHKNMENKRNKKDIIKDLKNNIDDCYKNALRDVRKESYMKDIKLPDERPEEYSVENLIDYDYMHDFLFDNLNNDSGRKQEIIKKMNSDSYKKTMKGRNYDDTLIKRRK